MVAAESEADRLIQAFGSLPEVLAARPAVISKVADESVTGAAIEAFRAAMVHALRVDLEARPLIPDSRCLRDYLMATTAGRTAEEVRVLYLTGDNHLIRDELLTIGTLDHARPHVREIIHRGLELGAANMVLVHNHPSGDMEPSQDDVRFTKRVIDVSRPLNFCVLDHMVVGREGVSSMRAKGLI